MSGFAAIGTRDGCLISIPGIRRQKIDYVQVEQSPTLGVIITGLAS